MDEYLQKFNAVAQLTDIQSRQNPQVACLVHSQQGLTSLVPPHRPGAGPRMKAKIEHYKTELEKKGNEIDNIYTEGVVDGFKPLYPDQENQPFTNVLT